MPPPRLDTHVYRIGLGVGMTDVLDAETDHGRVYRALVGHPRTRVPGIVERTGLPEAAVERALHDLLDDGAVSELGGAWEAHSPAEVTEELLRRDAERQAGLRRNGIELEQLFRFVRRESGHYGALEVIDDTARISWTAQQMQRAAKEQFRVVDRPPYFAPDEYYVNQEVMQRERMDAGVVYRTIYFDSAFEDPLIGPNMARMMAAGEQARTLADPPVKLLLADHDSAVLTLDAEGAHGVVSLFVRPSGLLDALSGVFETLWKLSVPVSAAHLEGFVDDRDRQIISLMASGATDDAIARRLNLSRRTVVRRTAALFDRLGATTRFQAGVQASRRGWL